MDKEKQEMIYDEIVALYDNGNNIVDNVELLKSGIEFAVSLVEPIVDQIETSTGNMGDTYLETIAKTTTPKEVRVFETGIRAMFETILNYTDNVENSLAQEGQVAKILKPSASIFDNFIEDSESLWTGPHSKELKAIMLSHASLSPVTVEVLKFGWTLERMARAFQHRDIGLIKNISMVEPGVRGQQRTLVAQKIF